MDPNTQKRTQLRLPAEQTVQLTILGTTELSIIGEVVNVSGGGVRLLVDCPVRPGSPIQVGLGASALIGEVRYCQAEEQRFALGIQLEKRINSVSDLARVLR
jgi:hypothetical protein